MVATIAVITAITVKKKKKKRFRDRSADRSDNDR